MTPARSGTANYRALSGCAIYRLSPPRHRARERASWCCIGLICTPQSIPGRGAPAWSGGASRPGCRTANFSSRMPTVHFQSAISKASPCRRAICRAACAAARTAPSGCSRSRACFIAASLSPRANGAPSKRSNYWKASSRARFYRTADILSAAHRPILPCCAT